jgi:hypothetical protein
MKFPKISKVVPFIALMALIMAFMSIPLYAQETTAISGRITATYTQEEPVNIADTKDHVVNLIQSKGTNESTGEQVMMDGAEIVNVSFSDLVSGNGDQQGYVTFVSNVDTTIAQWHGKVTTTSTEEGESLTNFEGTFIYIYGSGKYKGISGKGTYKGGFAAKNKYWSDWQGDYTLGK